MPIRNDSPTMLSGVLLPQRVLPMERPAGQPPATSEVFPLTHSDAAEAVLGSPRATHTIKFLDPSSVAPVKDDSPMMARRTELSVAPSIMPPVAVPSSTPMVMPTPIVPQEKQEIPGYSPWDRRAYTVLPSEDLDENSAVELPAPVRLQKNSTTTAPKNDASK